MLKEDQIKAFLDYLNENCEGTVTMDDLNGAIIGLDTEDRVVYDFNKMRDILVERDGMTDEEAVDYLGYNTVRAMEYMGEKRPVVMYPVEEYIPCVLEDEK